MFTGIIEALGRITSVTSTGIHVETRLTDTKPGDSIAVDGICLTTTKVHNLSGGKYLIELGISGTTRSRIRPFNSGTPVNLERALRLTDRIGGHFVTGHIDGSGIVKKITRDSDSWKVEVAVPEENREQIMDLIVPRGSVTVNGVSLTVSGRKENSFEITLIPYTLKTTTLGKLKIGNRVNLEADILARYKNLRFAQNLFTSRD